MLAMQISPPAFPSFPDLPPPFYAPRMPPSPAIQTNSTSVFNALGSYADRIKVANAKTPAPNPSGVPASTRTPVPALKPAVNMGDKSQADPLQSVHEDQGQWETVQASRQRGRQDDKRGGPSGSNWRDRASQRDRLDEEGDRKGAGKSNQKPASSSVPPQTGEQLSSPRATATTPAGGTKRSAWGFRTPPIQSSQPMTTPVSTISTAIQTPATGPAQSGRSAPPSPSLGATTTTASVSLPGSTASPNLSAEVSLASTAPSSVIVRPDDGDDEGDWRVRSRQGSEDASVALAPKQAAPAPAVNAWDARKKTMGPTAVGGAGGDQKAAPPTTSQALQFGSLTLTPPGSHDSQLPNGHLPEGLRIGNKRKKKATSEPTSAVTPLNDDNFPDLAQAAEVAKTGEGKKEKIKEARAVDEEVDGEESASSRKPKWTPIPAAEMQAAVDAAEASRRHGKETAVRKKATKGESTSPNARGSKSRRSSVDSKRDGRMPRGTSTDIRLPPLPQSQTGPSNAYKPTFGTIRPGSESGSLEGRVESMANGISSAPLSRQTSRSSKRSPPVLPAAHLPTLGGPPNNFEGPSMIRFGAGPIPARVVGNTSVPSPQNTFANGPSSFPRPPRQNARGSFPGRRGGAFRPPPGGHGRSQFATSSMGQQPLAYVNGDTNLYQQGYGFGYPGMQSMPGYTAGQYMPVQASFMQMEMMQRGAPPPPMPQTMVPNLDHQRFYVLGQVEYYFSMQNLAMDFFLRQQMDSAGWIDIAMIASFNRVKSLTTDLAMIKEVMNLSSLLEVREDKVRLAHGQSQKWVLPDAKPTIMPVGIDDSRAHSDDESQMDPSMGIPSMLDPAFGTGYGEGPTPKFGKGGVEIALMKSGGMSVVASSSPSVLNGDESMERSGTEDAEKTDTPGTSLSGDGKDEAVETESR